MSFLKSKYLYCNLKSSLTFEISAFSEFISNGKTFFDFPNISIFSALISISPVGILKFLFERSKTLPVTDITDSWYTSFIADFISSDITIWVIPNWSLKSKLDYAERQAALERISKKHQNRFIDAEDENKKDDKETSTNNTSNENTNIPLQTINIEDTNTSTNNNANIIHEDNTESTQKGVNNDRNEDNDRYGKSDRRNRFISDEENDDNKEENTEENVKSDIKKTAININDISEARAKREGSRYISEELSKILTSVVADDENIEKIGNTINVLKDSNDKNKKKINVNKFIDNL